MVPRQHSIDASSDVPSNLRGDRKARGDDKRESREEEERRIQITREPACPAANFQVLVRWDFTHSILQHHTPPSYICSLIKGKIKLVQDGAVSSFLAASDYKLNINRA